MTTVAEEVRGVEAKHILQVYKRLPVVLVRGAGSRVFDANGREYLDFLSGIGVASLGHGHPGLAAAIETQARELLHTSNLFFHPLQGQLAARLATWSGLPRAFFCNSGTEAVEACLKFARRYWHTTGYPERKEIVAFDRSFHGRTFGSLSVTSGLTYREPFEPLVPNVQFVNPDDPAALQNVVSSSTAAIIIEPIQGEGGIRPISTEMADTIAVVCKETGTLLISDEVQCGLGRTGQPFYSAVIGLQPDLMSLGKAMGAGVPIGAALLNQRVAEAVAPGDHGSTYGGNLLACRAALVFLDVMENGLLARVGKAGDRLGNGLRSLAKLQPVIGDIRGTGLMWGIDIKPEVAEQIVPVALEHGLIINRTAGSVVRLLPPLTITDAEIDEGLTKFGATIKDLA